jgi:hypothetical protein
MNYIFVISLRTTEHNLTNLTLRVFTMRYYTSVKEGRGSEEDGEEGGREAVRKRMERKGEQGSEEDDYFNKFPPTMPSVVLENRLIRM